MAESYRIFWLRPEAALCYAPDMNPRRECRPIVAADPPVFMIGQVARIMDVCPATLRIWERKGLIRPRRLGKNRLYLAPDLERLKIIKELIQEKRLNIEGAKAVLSVRQCWEIKKCPPDQREACQVYVTHRGTGK